ncbi:hypothetical protein [Embleya scabrispora]|uniref:hypothetical protein n=1 Tax=Embleya scabrispora TaxID=159449 RepID=UPI0003A4AC15|nr:hypothetical protein [Embleya scabrispora]MYS78926.1 hypothetical protein [Streptomyces sp. SID5474]
MSDRGIREVGLDGELTRIAGTEVRIVVEGIAAWGIEWTDGPTVDRMRGHVAAVRTARRRVAPPEHRLAYRRRQSPRAWAARAIAVLRDANSARAVAAGAALRRNHPAAQGWRTGGLTPEDHALLDLVQRLSEGIADPERADRPEDEPLIRRLLDEGNHSKEAMCRLLNDGSDGSDGLGFGVGLGTTIAESPRERVRLRLVSGDSGR